jgi:hypothetical protein
MRQNVPLRAVEAIVLLGILLAFLLPAFFPGEPESEDSLQMQGESFALSPTTQAF